MEFPSKAVCCIQFDMEAGHKKEREQMQRDQQIKRFLNK